MQYWLIKTLLVIGLGIVIFFMLRPTKTQNSLALRRIGMLAIMSAAVFAIIFPEVFNQFARTIGVYSGTNLLVYLLVIAIFAQMASGYRRDAAQQQKLTQLARQVALQSAKNGLPPALEATEDTFPNESGIGEAKRKDQQGPSA